MLYREPKDMSDIDLLMENAANGVDMSRRDDERRRVIQSEIASRVGWKERTYSDFMHANEEWPQ
jgi:hypothetical protein